MMIDVPYLTPETVRILSAGVLMTIALTVLTTLLALGLGVLMCWLRLMQSRFANLIASSYIEIFRNIPALVLVIFFAFALPNAFDPSVRRNLFFNNDVMLVLRNVTGLLIPYYAVAVVIALSLNTSAYIAELLRAGTSVLARNHHQAARSLGATQHQAFFTLVFPHGLRAASPAIVTRLVHNMKNTALASFVAVPELFQATQKAISETFYAVELLLIASVLYWVIAWSFAWLLRHLLPHSQTGDVR